LNSSHGAETQPTWRDPPTQRGIANPRVIGRNGGMHDLIRQTKDLWEYRELLRNLAMREISVRYKQTALGVVWAVVQPLALMVVFTLFFSIALKVPSDGVAYPLFVYCALVPWGFFATSLTYGVPSLVNNAPLIRKVYFPREILPFSAILATLVDFALAMTVFVGMMLVFRQPIPVTVLYVPVLVVVQVLLVAGVSLGLSAVNVFYRDIRHAIPLLVQLWMFASPVIYPASIVPAQWRELYFVNPMACVLFNYRRVVLHGLPPDFETLTVACVEAVVILAVSWWSFSHLEEYFADVI
jgi:lipopolysaccharide transport system permease protein